jgi:hypothetical protein
VIRVRTPESSVELDSEERSLLRAVLREINQASYLLGEETAWTGFPELLSAVRAERTSPDTRVEIWPEQMKRLNELADRMAGHLGSDEFRTRTGWPLQQAQELMHRLASCA